MPGAESKPGNYITTQESVYSPRSSTLTQHLFPPIEHDDTYRNKKRRKSRPDQETMWDTRQRFKIDTVQKTTREIEGNEYTGYFCSTPEEGNWFIALPDQKEQLQLQKRTYELNGAKQELKGRQDRKLPITASEINHDANILLFMENWKDLVQLFYKDQIPDAKQFPRFREVDLNDYQTVITEQQKEVPCGSADFLGFGPDGQGILIDFGVASEKKVLQLYKQSLGVHGVLRDVNQDQGIIRLKQYIGIYDHEQDDGVKVIQLKTPFTTPLFTEKYSPFPLYPYLYKS